ncbi:serine hydrolase [Clostridium sp.]|uniref:serine hydrolase n=1 Tax=Clostridium sp. TaxID=1506 RepID=UPI003D6D6F51
MRKLNTIILLSIFILFNIAPIAKAQENPKTVSADSVVLMDAATGKILYEKNKDSAYPPASTTKIMTILLTLEKTKLDDIVTVSKNASLADGSKIYLREGEKLPVKELLYGLTLASANDCAIALAEHISGSVEEFAKLMNERAKSLGCTSTNFVNPNGLYDVNHKTSAYDLTLIMQELTKHDTYKEIAMTSSYLMAPTNKCKDKRPLWNGNRLIQKGDPYYYEDCVGGKTGYTVQSKHSYIAVATRNGQKLIVALVHDSKKTFFKDSRDLLDYGFDNFVLFKYFNKGDAVSNLTLKDGTVLPLLASEDLYIVKAKDSTPPPVVKIDGTNSDKLSIKKGDVVSKSTIAFGKDSYSLDLSSGIDYAKKSSLTNMFSKNNSKKSPLLANIIKYVLVALVLFIIFMRIRRARRRRRRKSDSYINNFSDRR